MNIKMIVCDMDGTLLNDEDCLSSLTRDALITAQQKGIRLVLASGRSYMKMMDFAKELRMDEFGGYLIEVNGMAIMDLKNKKRKVYQQLGQDACQTLFEAFYPYEVEQLYMIDDGTFHYLPKAILAEKIAYRKTHGYPEDYPLTASILGYIYDNRSGYPNLTMIQNPQDITIPINKVCVYDKPDKLSLVAKMMKEEFQDQFWSGMVRPNWLEICPLGITKGKRLMMLLEVLGIEPETVMCFGDGENDIEMIQSVSYGIAMGNALDTVKAAAFAVTESNNEYGIATALKRYNVI